MQDPVEELLARVDDAFGESRRPVGDEIVPHDKWERASWATFVETERWQDFEDSYVNAEHVALHSATPLGFRFLIPAFIRASLRDYGNEVLGTTAFSLMPCDLQWSTDAMERFATFDLAQCRVVAAYLTLKSLIDGDDGRDLDRALCYWHTRAEEARSL